jgi:hypothetical protein
MNTTQQREVESHQRFLANFRARLDALPDVTPDPIDPDDDTLDASESDYPPPPRTENTR